ncbi:hypothetical protein Vretifemale_19533 [Volvox reticuliferus]|uniref:Uncharacterized protein n=1 Tax=Volvox reticuliferus TaxID=1737510 RepID=A0A8J4FYQ5_9CHLO|nr:hypothetical protein Vretifemale_19533 [Volvox reticuliferus]
MSSIPRLTLLEVLQFLAEPLNCDTSLLARELLRALAARGRARPAIPFLNAVCRASCEWRIRPALLISLTAAIFISLVLTLRNACVTLVRWYTAARGSAFVAVATRALRELHASDAAAATAAASGLLRPAAVHRWYFPQSVTAPVVCCGCFQPVLVAQDAEGRAQVRQNTHAHTDICPHIGPGSPPAPSRVVTTEWRVCVCVFACSSETSSYSPSP